MLVCSYDQPRKMSRPLWSLLFSFLLVGSSFASASSANKSSLKRKLVEIKTGPGSDSIKSGRTSAESRTPSSSNVSPVLPTAVKTESQKSPPSPWLIADKFDLNPEDLPQRKDNLYAYRSLFMAIGRGDFETTCLLLNLFDDLKMTRYFKELKNGNLLTFYHLAIVKFPVEEFKTIVTFGEESDLVYPSSKGSTVFDMAMSSRDESKISYLSFIFTEHSQRMSELKTQISQNGLISLFIKSEL